MNYTDLMLAIKLMGQGMCGIFVVMSVIALIVYVAGKILKGCGSDA